MSLIILGHTSDNLVSVLDTDDMKVDLVTEDYIADARKLGLRFGTKLNFEITKTYNNAYRLSFFGNTIYEGSFEPRNERNDLVGFKIQVIGVKEIWGRLYVCVGADCYCKYDIEVPMVQIQILSISLKSMKNIICACKTSEPVYFSDSAELKRNYEAHFGDFPNKSISPRKMVIRLEKNKIKVFGVEYNSPPVYDIINLRVNFNKV